VTKTRPNPRIIDKTSSVLAKRLLFLVALTSLVISPNVSYDPINVIKLVLLSATATGAFFYAVLLNVRTESKARQRILVIWLLATLGIFLVSTLMSKQSFATQFFGTYGRNTGLLAWTSFIVLIFSFSIIGSRLSSLSVFISVQIIGVLNLIYSTLQTLDLDPVLWNTQYNPIVGTLGNPNFVSSLFGACISGLLAFTLLNRDSTLKLRLGLVALMVWYMIIIYRSESIQGFFLISIGLVAMASIVVAKKFRRDWRTVSFLVLTFLSVVIIFMGLLGHGALGSLLANRTFIIRYQYWMVAIDGVMDRPWLGLGFDSFGSYFRVNRPQELIDMIGEEIFTNSPHNVFLDLAFNAGVIALILLLLVKILTLAVGLKLIMTNSFESEKEGRLFLAVFVIWICLETQTLISVNQIGLNIWVFVLNGFVLARWIFDSRNLTYLGVRGSSYIQSPGLIIGVMLGALLGSPAYGRDTSYVGALKSGSLSEVTKVARDFPQDPERIRHAIVTIDQQGFTTESVDLLRFGLKLFPNDYSLQVLKRILSGTTEEEKLEALAKLREIDPKSVKWK